MVQTIVDTRLIIERDDITHSTRYRALGHPVETGYGDETRFSPTTPERMVTIQKASE